MECNLSKQGDAVDKPIIFSLSLILERLTLAEYHEQEEIFKLRLGHLKKVCLMFHFSAGKLSFCEVQTDLLYCIIQDM